MANTVVTAAVAAIVGAAAGAGITYSVTSSRFAAEREQLTAAAAGERDKLLADARKQRDQLEAKAKEVVAQVAATAEQQAKRVAAEADKLKLPDLPIRVSFRKAVLGSGAVARFESYGANEIAAELTIKGTSGKGKSIERYVLSPKVAREIGYAEGWAFVPGDELLVAAPGFRPAVYRCC